MVNEVRNVFVISEAVQSNVQLQTPRNDTLYVLVDQWHLLTRHMSLDRIGTGRLCQLKFINGGELASG